MNEFEKGLEEIGMMQGHMTDCLEKLRKDYEANPTLNRAMRLRKVRNAFKKALIEVSGLSDEEIEEVLTGTLETRIATEGLEEIDARIAAGIPEEYEFPGDDPAGFAGILRVNYGVDAKARAELWTTACFATEIAYRPEDRRYVRNFLRSSKGRHLADDLSFRIPPQASGDDLRKAIATTDWLAWAASFQETARDTLQGHFND